MSDCDHINEPRIVKDLVYDPICTHSDSPEIPRPAQLPTAGRPWISGQGLDTWEDSGYEMRLEALQLFASGAGKTDNVFTQSVSTSHFAAGAAER
jgi:hypothetical protein